ncbi:MAG: hypothetical protein U5L96_02545 [Owenweeksia sp.]|nr:hypothetical protein [Owenweeksia sp.]
MQTWPWEPGICGGMHKIIEGMVALAIEKGVVINTGEAVEHIEVHNGRAHAVNTTKGIYEADVVVAGADYHHVEQQLLAPGYRNYSEKYWQSRQMAPSSLLFYLGINKKLDNLLHHNLYFDKDFDTHAREIYETPAWPSNPLFYVSCTSKTDPTCAPEGMENLFILMPVAPGLKDEPSVRERYYDILINRLEYLSVKKSGRMRFSTNLMRTMIS